MVDFMVYSFFAYRAMSDLMKMGHASTLTSECCNTEEKVKQNSYGTHNDIYAAKTNLNHIIIAEAITCTCPRMWTLMLLLNQIYLLCIRMIHKLGRTCDHVCFLSRMFLNTSAVTTSLVACLQSFNSRHHLDKGCTINDFHEPSHQYCYFCIQEWTSYENVLLS